MISRPVFLEAVLARRTALSHERFLVNGIRTERGRRRGGMAQRRIAACGDAGLRGRAHAETYIKTGPALAADEPDGPAAVIVGAVGACHGRGTSRAGDEILAGHPWLRANGDIRKLNRARHCKRGTNAQIFIDRRGCGGLGG